MIQTYLVDNSALNNILSDENSTDTLNEALVSQKCRLIIPLNALNEAMAGEKIEFIHRRLKRLYSLVAKSSPQLIVLSKGNEAWLINEFRNRGKLKNIPCLINSARWKGLLRILENKDELAEFHNRLSNIRASEREYKKSLSEIDKKYREKVLEKCSQSELRDWLLNFKRPKKIKEIDHFLSSFRFIRGLSKRKARRILGSPSLLAYWYLKTYLAVLQFRAIGNGLNNCQNDEQLSFLNKLTPGNWYDLSLIVMASRSEWLLSDDVGQCQLNDFLKERSIVSSSSIGSGDFLIKIKCC